MKENFKPKLDNWLVATGDQTIAPSSWALTCCLCEKGFFSTDASRTRCYVCERRLSQSFNFNKTEGFHGYGTNEFDEE